MALDFVKFIGDNSPSLSVAQKIELLDNLAIAFGYTATVISNGNMIPNPLTKKEVVNNGIQGILENMLNSTRRRIAEQALVITNIEFK
jgi:hypothetical protein